MAQERIKMEEERAREMERMRIQRLNEEMEMVIDIKKEKH